MTTEHQDKAHKVLTKIDSLRGEHVTVQPRYYECFNVISNRSGRIATNLLMKILEHGRAKTTDDNRYKGTFWLSPMSRRDLMHIIDPLYTQSKDYKADLSNFGACMKDLIDGGVFREICVGSIYSYTYVHNIFSWQVFCIGPDFIYPGEICKLIDSRSDVLGMFYKARKGSGLIQTSFDKNGVAKVDVVQKPRYADKHLVAFKELFSYFADFIAYLVSQTPPVVKNVLENKGLLGQPKNMYPATYFMKVRSVLGEMDGLEGFDWENVRVNLLPEGLWREMAPQTVLSDPVFAKKCHLANVTRRVPEPLPARSLAYNTHKAITSRRELYKGDLTRLDVIGSWNSAKLYAECFLAKKIGDPGSFFPFFQNFTAEESGFNSLKGIMLRENCWQRNVLCDAITWFVDNFVDDDELHGDYVFFAELRHAWPRFRARMDSLEVTSNKGVLFERMSIACDSSYTGTPFLIEDFGIRKTYDFLLYNYGRKRAEVQILKCLKSLKTQARKSALRRAVENIFKASYMSYYRSVFMPAGGEISEAFKELMQECDVSAGQLGVKRSPRMTSEEREFAKLMLDYEKTVIANV